MSATMLKLIEPANPLSQGFTIEQCFNTWGPGCKNHPNELRLVEYNAYVNGAPYRPMLQCRVCGEVYSVSQATVISSADRDLQIAKGTITDLNVILDRRDKQLAEESAKRLAAERELVVLRMKVAEYAANAKLSAQEADRDITTAESNAFDRGYHACMNDLAGWLREYVHQERDGEPSVHRFDDRIAMELFFYGESDFCKEAGGLS